jgi:glycosyltransferase involved in cell wall biosynthesis
MPSFALAILNRNQASELERTLKSLRGCSFDEILILDDFSDEDPTILVEQLKSALGFADIHVHLSTSNIGTFENVKRAFVLAKSDFVTLMSADDVLSPSYLLSMQRYAVNVRKSRVFVPVVQVTFDGFWKSQSHPEFSRFRILDFVRLRKFNLSHGGGAIYPRVAVCNSKLYEIKAYNLVDDWLVYYLLSESGFKLIKVKDVLYFHEVGEALSDIEQRKARHRYYEQHILEIINNRKLNLKMRIAVWVYNSVSRAKRKVSTFF